MENKDDELIAFLKNQVTVEKEIVQSLEKPLAGMKTPLLRRPQRCIAGFD